jgi:hypothetical protein
MERHCHRHIDFGSEQDLQANGAMRESKVEPVRAIHGLVDACNQCSELLLLGSVSTAEPAFRQLAQALHWKFDQFRFELQTEIRRLGGANPDSLRPEPLPENSDIAPMRAEISLQLALDNYQQALNGVLPAHARAMIKRQCNDIEQAYRELVSLHRAA